MITGIQNGMVMQRAADNCCDVYFTSNTPVKSVCCDGQDARIERQGERYNLRGIHAGGPYTIKIDDVVFADMYVGDVWVLAGQSNMQGIARVTREDTYNANDRIRAFFMNGQWGRANHPLHELGKARQKVHTQVLGRDGFANPVACTGPGLRFAQEMFRLKMVPQGVIPCAHGGTTMEQWNPDRRDEGGEKSLYGAMYENFIQNGANVSGLFWYQGESDTNEAHQPPKFTESMVKLISAVRRDFGKNIPVVQVQLCRTINRDAQRNACWTSVREQQRLMSRHIENLDTAYTVTYRLDDGTHLNSSAMNALGAAAAESMYALMHGPGSGCLLSITLSKVEVFECEFDSNRTKIVLTFDNVHGALCCGARALGFSQGTDKNQPEERGVFDAYVDGNKVFVYIENPLRDMKDRWLWYGFGTNPCCNIVDERNRPVPAFGPIALCETERFAMNN